MKNYPFKNHQISPSERLWLQEVANASIHFERKVAKVKLLGKLPDEFNPEQIDSRLCKDGKLTLVGLWHIDPSNELLAAIPTVISAIRSLIIEKPHTSEVTVASLETITNLDQPLVARALRAMGDLGNFNSGGVHSADGLGFSIISLVGDYAFDEYLAYKSLDDLLERFYSTRDPSANIDPANMLPWTRSTTEIFGSARTTVVEGHPVKRNTAFVLMAIDPLKPELVDVYMAIKEICRDFEINAYRADEIQHQDRITDRILQEIDTCEYLIADLTHERPNVYYEVGYAHAKNKKPILFRRADTRLHFDLSVHNVPEYRNVTELRDLLRKRFAAILGREPKTLAEK